MTASKIAADLLKVRQQEAYPLAVAKRTGISYEILQPQLQAWVDKRWLRTQGECYQVTGLGWQ
jgi:hypothetical protein